MSESPSTPRRKIVNTIAVPAPRSAKKARSTLQDRLAGVAAGATRIPRPSCTSSSVSSGSTPLSIPSTPGPSRELSKSSDKVIVCVRIKPTTSPFALHAYEVTPNSLSLSDTHPNVLRRGGKAGREAEYTYNFDTLVQFPTRTPELYKDKIAPLVQQAMNGFNSTVFAYGQTGSGKSHTMSGTRTELGIIPCAVDGIFDAITDDPERAFLLRVSYLEIYNEGIRDLLCPKRGDEAKVPTIKTAKGKDGQGKVFVDPLQEKIVSTPQDVVEILSLGNRNRKTGATDWNERSSRSHAVFTITIESRPRDGDGHDEVRVSRLTLIDLAGSEKAVSNVERRGEGKHINQSLLALREVVHKLTDTGKRGHIPFRNSKLTHLLENVLGGDSNICVICTMSSEEEHCAETLETLKFAGRCSQVETKAQKNILHGSDLAVIRAKDREIAELKAQLESLASSARSPQGSILNPQMSGLADELAAMQARKDKLAEQLSKLNSEILTSELPRSRAGLPMEQPRKRRPRISDFTSLTAASSGIGLGLGLPGTPKKQIDRRAVSTMVRVADSLYDDDSDSSFVDNAIETLDPSKAFDHDITIASLRRTIASRDGDIAKQAHDLRAALAEAGELSKIRDELAAAKAELNDATVEHTRKLADAQESFGTAQLALETTLAEKSSRVEELEANIVELSQSHAKSSAEVQAQLANVQAELQAATSERDERLKEIDELKAAHSAEITKIKESIKALRAKADENAARVAELEDVRAQLQSSLKAVEEERDSVRSDHANVQREAEQAKLDLEAYQTASAGRESEAMASFKSQLDGEREARSKAEIALEEAAKAANARASEAAEEKARLENELGEASARLEEATKAKLEVEARIADADAAAKQAALHAAARHDELTAKVNSLTAEGEEHRQAGQDLEVQLGALTAQLEAKCDEHETLARQLADVQGRLESKIASADEISCGLEESKAALEARGAELAAALAERDEAKAALEAAKAAHDMAAADLNTRLEETIRARDEVKAALEAKTAAHDEVSATLAALQTKLDSKAQVLDDATKAHDDIKTKLEAATALNNERAKELADILVQLEAKTAAHTEVEAALEATQAELATKSSALKEATTASQSLTAQLEEKREALAKTQAELATTMDELSSKSSALEEAAATSKSLMEDLASTSKARTEFEAQLGITNAELEDKTASLATATAEIDSLRAGADIAASIRTDLEEHRALLETEKAERAKLAEAHASATTRGEALVKEVEETKAALAVEREARKASDERIAALEAELATSKKEREALSAELTASKTERDDIKAQLTTATTHSSELQGKLDKMDKDLGEVRGHLDVARASSASNESENRTERERLMSEAEAHKRAVAAAEIRLASFTADSTLKHSDLAEEVAKARSSAEDATRKPGEHKAAAARMKESLVAAEAQRSKAMEGLKADLATVKAGKKTAEASAAKANADLAAAKQSLSEATAEIATIKAKLAQEKRSDALDKELTLARSEYDAMKARCERLADELLTASAHANGNSSPTKRGFTSLSASGSVPSLLSSAGSAALRGAGMHPVNGGWASSPAAVELSRLDKVVEAQKAVIEEQRAKISFWALELDKQNEAVRLLSADLENCTCGERERERDSRGHLRASLSMSSVPSPSKENLSPAPAAYASARSRGHISSSFAARNLAMPTAPSAYQYMPGSPSPLPMHPSQFSNSRKHRRVTLEHDINRLQEGGRVSSIKNVFDRDEPPSPTRPRAERVGSRHTSVRRG
ncbi:kinesin-domain-containing protein [Cutaneotrichosporon oleaginosum]|uniref:Kinesin-domain-containing protein n=1 Tax=Cutaneotrichosporon oleaginosum TaxID=879819 RepID=A0A0J1BBT0_9TREE|nr:kinesin-domain-containing protein [Cutaneotrichosporon oleaginosum]KLT45454.1 kinesin-domain-containing protein [Cutaneotrichosporon oleaginosum]